jgi:hypothetical protein
MSETRKRQLRTFPNLVASDFQHSHDIAATTALKSDYRDLIGLQGLWDG